MGFVIDEIEEVETSSSELTCKMSGIENREEFRITLKQLEDSSLQMNVQLLQNPLKLRFCNVKMEQCTDSTTETFHALQLAVFETIKLRQKSKELSLFNER